MVSLQCVIFAAVISAADSDFPFLAKCCMSSNTSGQTGCFGRCCRRRFDDDDFLDEVEREHREAAINFKPADHSSSDANEMHELPRSQSSYVDSQPKASRSMDLGRASLSNGRPAPNDTTPPQ